MGRHVIRRVFFLDSTVPATLLEIELQVAAFYTRLKLVNLPSGKFLTDSG